MIDVSVSCAAPADDSLQMLPPPNYNFSFHEDEGMEPEDMSCISLGCHCGTASCLNHLKLRTAAYPFDWNRTTLEGVIHFLRTGFADFLTLTCAVLSHANTGGKVFSGMHHSVWHEDLYTEDGMLKYHRRIKRFFGMTAPVLLFIRVVNIATEIVLAETLLELLDGLFAHSKVFLLLIVDCQQVAQSFFIGGTEGRLLVYAITTKFVKTLADMQHALIYEEAILFGSRWARSPERKRALELCMATEKSCEDLMAELQPFFGGPPQQVPFTPFYLGSDPRRTALPLEQQCMAKSLDDIEGEAAAVAPHCCTTGPQPLPINETCVH